MTLIAGTAAIAEEYTERPEKLGYRIGLESFYDTACRPLPRDCSEVHVNIRRMGVALLSGASRSFETDREFERFLATYLFYLHQGLPGGCTVVKSELSKLGNKLSFDDLTRELATDWNDRVFAEPLQKSYCRANS